MTKEENALNQLIMLAHDKYGFHRKHKDPIYIYTKEEYLKWAGEVSPLEDIDHELLEEIEKDNLAYVYEFHGIDETYTTSDLSDIFRHDIKNGYMLDTFYYHYLGLDDNHQLTYSDIQGMAIEKYLKEMDN